MVFPCLLLASIVQRWIREAQKCSSLNQSWPEVSKLKSAGSALNIAENAKISESALQMPEDLRAQPGSTYIFQVFESSFSSFSNRQRRQELGFKRLEKYQLFSNLSAEERRKVMLKLLHWLSYCSFQYSVTAKGTPLSSRHLIKYDQSNFSELFWLKKQKKIFWPVREAFTMKKPIKNKPIPIFFYSYRYRRSSDERRNGSKTPRTQNPLSFHWSVTFQKSEKNQGDEHFFVGKRNWLKFISFNENSSSLKFLTFFECLIWSLCFRKEWVTLNPTSHCFLLPNSMN